MFTSFALYASMFTLVFGVYFLILFPHSITVLLWDLLPLPIFLILVGLALIAALLAYVRMVGDSLDMGSKKTQTIVVISSAVLAFLSAIAMSAIQIHIRKNYGEGGFFATSDNVKFLVSDEPFSLPLSKLLIANSVRSFFLGLPIFLVGFMEGDFDRYVTVTRKTGYDGGTFESSRSDPFISVLQFILIGAFLVIPEVFLCATPIIFFIPAAYALFLLFTFKKNLAITACAILGCAAIGLTAFSLTRSQDLLPKTESEGIEYTINQSENGYIVTGYSGSDTDVIIPELYRKMPIKAIAPSTFEKNSAITSVSLPASLIKIDEKAFSGCTSLSSVIIADGSALSFIEKSAFENCTSLSSFKLPSSVKKLGSSAFKGCENMKSFNIGSASELEEINSSCFENCKLLEGFNLPKKLKTLGDKIFAGCVGIESLVIPDSVTTISNSAFSDCTNLKSVTIGVGVSSDLNNIFRGCKALTDVTISEGVTSLSGTFRECENLKSITLPSTLVRIDDFAFYNCKNLTSLTIPARVSYIGVGAFSGCDALESVVFEEPNNWKYVSTIHTDFLNEVFSDPERAALVLRMDSHLAFKTQFYY